MCDSPILPRARIHTSCTGLCVCDDDGIRGDKPKSLTQPQMTSPAIITSPSPQHTPPSLRLRLHLHLHHRYFTPPIVMSRVPGFLHFPDSRSLRFVFLSAPPSGARLGCCVSNRHFVSSFLTSPRFSQRAARRIAFAELVSRLQLNRLPNPSPCTNMISLDFSHFPGQRASLHLDLWLLASSGFWARSFESAMGLNGTDWRDLGGMGDIELVQLVYVELTTTSFIDTSTIDII